MLQQKNARNFRRAPGKFPRFSTLNEGGRGANPKHVFLARAFFLHAPGSKQISFPNKWKPITSSIESARATLLQRGDASRGSSTESARATLLQRGDALRGSSTESTRATLLQRGAVDTSSASSCTIQRFFFQSGSEFRGTARGQTD